MRQVDRVSVTHGKKRTHLKYMFGEIGEMIKVKTICGTEKNANRPAKEEERWKG